MISEYLVLIVCFGFLILLRIFLFKKSYQNKLIYFSDPMELAKEVIAENKKLRNPIE